MRIVQETAATVEVLARLGAQALRKGFAKDPAPDTTAFERRLRTLLAQVPGDLINDFQFIRLPANQPPWHDTGIALAPGATVTTFACGRTYLSRALDVYVDPHFQLWMRVGTDGILFRGTRATHSFMPEHAGNLHLASYFPGEWAKPDGTLRTSPHDYRKVSGEMTVLVIRWASGVTAAQGLEALARLGDVDGLIAAERERLAHPHAVPDGWQELWFLGPSEIYTRCNEDSAHTGICCHTHRDVAILQRDVDVPLRPDTRLDWSWKVDQLPSRLREDTVPTHDYLSIAVEFDNGLDLTYMWSAKLPVGHHFWCPLPTWKGREWHWVVRSGNTQLGQWLDESRTVYPDYQAAIGGVMPTRIVRVWLISVSLFQRGEGRAAYANIRLNHGDKTTDVQ
ncbi:MAG: DUF3047 domain-containing protein [Nevskiaceae bacterium]|nr:MAG: DUF3047 domain-containing protein [Nevskiaceae bacterium]TBR74749.1 MAG: DUF3047 domain-containing protein [Nevskiaceae bacterium]